MNSYGPPHMAKQKQDDQLELTYSSYVKTQDVTLKTCRRRWMIGRSGERWSGISVWRHDMMMIMTVKHFILAISVFQELLYLIMFTIILNSWTLYTWLKYYIYIYIYIYQLKFLSTQLFPLWDYFVYIFPNTPPRGEYDIRSVFKRGTGIFWSGYCPNE